jgi:hypothetical protein
MYVVIDMDIQDDSFDWDAPLDEIFGITVLVMDRKDPDISVRLLGSDDEVAAEIGKEFGNEDFLQLVVVNRDEGTRYICPYFRIIMNQFVAQSTSPVNKHLEAFYESIGMNTLSARTDKAMVVGACDLTSLSRTTSVPIQYSITKLPEVGMGMDLDSDCLKVCARELYKQEDLTLCDISGLYIPYHIPLEAQWLVLSYLRSPTAELIEAKIGELCMAWDIFMWPMFVQREPRIPCTIAHCYGVPTVLTTISGATRSFLAPSALRGGGTVVSV